MHAEIWDDRGLVHEIHVTPEMVSIWPNRTPEQWVPTLRDEANQFIWDMNEGRQDPVDYRYYIVR